MTFAKPFNRIAAEPGKMGGKPCIRGYRFPCKTSSAISPPIRIAANSSPQPTVLLHPLRHPDPNEPILANAVEEPALSEAEGTIHAQPQPAELSNLNAVACSKLIALSETLTAHKPRRCPFSP